MDRVEVYKPKRQETAQQAKERLEVTAKCKKLFIRYHNRKLWGMASLKLDQQLYPQFVAIRSKFKYLPKPLQWPFMQRFAYTAAMKKLGEKKELENFIRKYTPVKLANLNFSQLVKKVKATKDFKDLPLGHLIHAKNALRASIAVLAKIPAGSKWATDAQKYFTDKNGNKTDRIDDHIAAPRLRRGFAAVYKNLGIIIKQKRKAKQAPQK